MRGATSLLLIAATLGPACARASDNALAGVVIECDRQCLEKHVDTYMSALASRDPARVPWAEHARFSENNVPMKAGDGLWGTVTKVRDFKLYVADPREGSIGFFGAVEESGSPSVFSLRLKIRQGRVVEAETVVARKRTYREDFPNPDGLADAPIFREAVPQAERRTRQQLISIGNSYFETLEQNDGTVFAPFDPQCDRREDGVRTTNNPARATTSGNAFPALGCEAQFKSGYFRFVTSIRDRRVLAVDEERGLVLMAGFFDHGGGMRTVRTTDGVDRKIGPPNNTPYSFIFFEVFKVKNGKIRQVEAALEDVPYGMKPIWEVRQPAVPQKQGSVAATPCDRACLTGFVHAYMKALLARDPLSLPWAQHVRFTENNVPLKLGDGLWATIDVQRPYELIVADPKTGQVGMFGVVEEAGAPAPFSLRLRIEAGKIAEVDTVVVRRVRNPELPMMKDKPVMTRAVPEKRRRTREQMIAIANSYFDTLQRNDGTIHAPFDPQCNRVENGTQTTNNASNDRDYSPGASIMRLGCEAQFKTGFFKYVTRIRDRRFLAVDEERGLVWSAAFFDHAGTMPDVTLTDGRTVPAQFRRPWTWQIVEVFKIDDGKLRQIEAVVLHAPYNTIDEWAGH